MPFPRLLEQLIRSPQGTMAKSPLQAARRPRRARRTGVRPGAGEVWLVGAGPGDPELLTVKALKALQRADVVVHDRLTPQAILDLAGARARLIDVGKRKSRHTRRRTTSTGCWSAWPARG